MSGGQDPEQWNDLFGRETMNTYLAAFFADETDLDNRLYSGQPMIVSHQSALEMLQFLLWECKDKECNGLRDMYAVRLYVVPPCTEIEHSAEYCKNVIRGGRAVFESLLTHIPRPFRK